MRKFLYLCSLTVHFKYFFKLPVILKCDHLVLYGRGDVGLQLLFKKHSISGVYKFVITLPLYPGSATFVHCSVTVFTGVRYCKNVIQYSHIIFLHFGPWTETNVNKF